MEEELISGEQLSDQNEWNITEFSTEWMEGEGVELVIVVDDNDNNDDEDGVELESTSNLQVLEYTGGIPWMEKEENNSKNKSTEKSMEILRNKKRVPSIRRERRSSFIQDEQNLMIRLDNSLIFIFNSLENLRIRSLEAHVLHPEMSQKFMYSSENEKLKEAFKRFSDFKLSRKDLIALGPLPSRILPIIKQNQVALWSIFRCYCPPNCKFPPCSTSADIYSSNGKKESKRRLLSLSSIWDLLRDFDFCPELCTYVLTML